MYYQIMNEIGEKGIAEIIEYDNTCDSVIEKWDININFKRSLQWYWFGKQLSVGPTLYGVEQILKSELSHNNLTNGLLLIGDGPNGDEIMVKKDTLEVYFWNHEIASDYEQRLKKDCQKLYDHILYLLLHIRNKNFIPMDAFVAEEYYQLFKGK